MGLKCIGFFCVALWSVALIPLATGTMTVEVYGHQPKQDARICARGPTYWCQNITNAKSCSAVKHCIQTVWELQTLPPDNGSICDICKDMVAQARAQLESNETQEELREVFEGSCKLIPIKVVQKECIKLSDEFIPELVETLSSQMNPQVVCSVAGLCNNARNDKLIEAAKNGGATGTSAEAGKCDNCNRVATEMEQKFLSTTKDDILNNMLEACGHMGSFSDGCSAAIITHFENLYEHLKKHFNAEGICHLSGMCQYQFHTHDEKGIEVVHQSSVGVLKPKEETCDLCKTLVVDLRNFLVANTTESEFEMVLKGLCKQFKSFKDECLSITDEYYGVIYQYLINDLNPEGICSIAGICPRPKEGSFPLWPLVPTETVNQYETYKLQTKNDGLIIPASRPIIGRDEANSLNNVHRVHVGDKHIGVRVQDDIPPPLPISRLMPQTLTYVANRQICTFCEYFLHYLQVALTTPATEDEIRKVVDEACDHLPNTINEQCKSFVDTYGDAFVALLAQEIDPSQVCPKLGLCPESEVLVSLTQGVEDKPTCPLCLFAVQSLITKLKNNKTEDEIRKALDTLCTDLPKSLTGECRTFVEDYSEQLIDMIVADFTPQEVCAYLKLCDPSIPKPTTDAEIITNEVNQLPIERLMPQTVINAELDKMQPHVEDNAVCVLCEFIMNKLESALKDNATEAEIKEVVHDVCNWMPKTVLRECNDFVNKYADLVISVLAMSLDPKEVCTEIKLCAAQTQFISASLEQCAVCDAIIGALEQILEDPAIEKDAARALQKVCDVLSEKNQEKCKSMVKIYGPSILNLLARETPTHEICEKLGLCPMQRQTVKLVGGKRCTWGPSYWCQSVEHAKSCGAIAHCQQMVWKKDQP